MAAQLVRNGELSLTVLALVNVPFLLVFWQLSGYVVTVANDLL